MDREARAAFDAHQREVGLVWISRSNSNGYGVRKLPLDCATLKRNSLPRLQLRSGA